MKKLNPEDKIKQERLRIRRFRRRLRKPTHTSLSVPTGRAWPKYTVVRAPRVLDWQDDNLPALVNYLAKIRHLALGGNRRVLVNLEDCEIISPVACLMLTAELQRCLIIRPNCINGVDPRNAFAQWTLDALGFYKTIGMPRPTRGDSHGIVLQIQTGGLGPEGIATGNAGQQIYQVSKIAKQVFKDELFADRVHAALNEAADNSINWAYDEDLINPKKSTKRWWICGFRLAGQESAFFFAYDQGVGIPRSAPKTAAERVDRALLPLLRKLGLDRTDAQDCHILEATINEQRTRSALDERGKGLTRMIELADAVHEGTVHILSGRALYHYSRDRDDEEPVEFSAPLSYMFPGTLVVWHVSAPLPVPEIVGLNG